MIEEIIGKCHCGKVRFNEFENWVDESLINYINVVAKYSHGVCSNECSKKYYGVDLYEEVDKE